MTTANDIFSDRVIAAAGVDPLVVLDLGARGAVDDDLLALAPAVSIIGFEPDPEEAARLAALPKGPWRELRILPFAIGRARGLATLHVPREPAGASLLPHNAAMIEQFGLEALHRTVKKIPIEGLSLDDLESEAGICSIDYLKIDIEGAELDVLEGGAKMLANAKVIKVECSFLEQRVGQPLAAEVICWLAERGFDLIDIRAIHHWRRRPLPSHPYSVGFDFPYSRGRIAQADLFFLRRHSPDAPGRDIAAATLILAAIGHIDLAMTVLRRCPSGDSWWREQGVDIESELKAASGALGRKALRAAIAAQIRGAVPLVKSWFGLLSFRAPEHRY